MRCTSSTGSSRPTVTFHAETADDEQQLAGRAAWLRRAAHPGVVELVATVAGSDGLAELTTVAVEGRDLAALGALDVRTVAGLGAAVATTLADLHTLGVVHGALTADRVVVDGSGRPVLLEPPRGTLDPLAGADVGGGRVDVTALAGLLRSLLASPPPRRVERLLRHAEGHRPPGSPRLAEGLLAAVGDARLPASATETDGRPFASAAVRPRPDGSPTTVRSLRLPAGTPARQWRTFGRLASAVPVVALVLAAGAVAWFATGANHQDRPTATTRPAAAAPAPGPPETASRRPSAAGHRRSPVHGRAAGAPAPQAGAHCPTTDQRCRPVRIVDHRFRTAHGTFASDLHAAVIVLGRWWCGRVALPAALDPADGRLWVWTAWDGHRAATARPVGLVPDAVSLRTVPSAEGCDVLRVLRRAAAPVVVDVGAIGRA